MRWLAAAILLVLLPTAGAASQVHATWLGDAYAVTFVSNATGPTIPVATDKGEVLAVHVEAHDGDIDRTFRAKLPAGALRYTVEGRSFALPAPPDEDDTTRVVFVADVGGDANASAVLRAILRERPSLVLMGGDLSYANGNASVWNDWFDLIEPLAASVAVMPAYGNHEDYCEREGGALYHCGPEKNGWHAHFPLPNEEKLYYAFDWGPLHVTSLDTEAYVGDDPSTDPREQHAFLNASLADERGRWNVVMYHRPLQTTNAKEGLASEHARDMLEPLLTGRVPLVLQAHTHAYERAHPQNGTTYVTSGGGGRPLYASWRAEEPWLAKRAAEHHFLVLDASPTRIEVRAVRPDGYTLDAFVLERDAPARPSPSPSPIPPPTARDGLAPDGSNVTGSIAENGVPGPGFLALVVVLMLSARRRRGRVLPTGR